MMNRLSEDRRGWIEELWPRVRCIARYCVRREGGYLDDAESGAQWGLVRAALEYQGDARDHWEDFRRLAACGMFRAAIGSIKRRGAIGKDDFIVPCSGRDGAAFDIEDKKSFRQFDLLISEWNMETLRDSMSPEEWSVIRCIVIDSGSLEDAAGELGVTLSRSAEIYDSAAEKIRRHYDDARLGMPERGRGRGNPRGIPR